MQARMTDSLEPPKGAGSGKTAQSYIAGIGASGALLAGAVVTFVFLVGTVSFDVGADADSDSGTKSLGVAELRGDGGSATLSLGTTVVLIADSVRSPTAPSAGSGGGGDGGGGAAPKADGSLEGAGGGTDDGSGGTGGTGDTGDTGGGTGGGDGGTAGNPPGGGGSGGNGENQPSDRPTTSNPRPSGSSGATGTGTAGGTGTSTGGPTDSDRPSAGDRGRG